jgi:hypothetical protein
VAVDVRSRLCSFKASIVTTTERTFVIRVTNGVAQWVNVGVAREWATIEVFGALKEATQSWRGSDEVREGQVNVQPAKRLATQSRRTIDHQRSFPALVVATFVVAGMPGSPPWLIRELRQRAARPTAGGLDRHQDRQRQCEVDDRTG